MRLSKMHIKTLREVPNEAEISSHILLLRTGMIRKLVSGVYGFMPLGWRSVRKIEDIVRQEMDATGAQEIHMVRRTAGGAVAGVRQMVRLRTGAVASAGQKRQRFLSGTDPRGDLHRSDQKRRVFLQTAADEPVSDPDQVQGRGETSVRPDEKQRVHHEGRLFL